MRTLRPYQSRTVKAVHDSTARSTCVVIPTGGGKTVVAEQLVQDRGATLFGVHTKELLKQTADRFRHAGHTVNVIAPGYYNVRDATMHVGTVQTLCRRNTFPYVSTVILDECHHYAKESDWATFLERYRDTRLIGLTATPQRQDGQPLGDRFDDMIVGAQYSELIAEGFLVPCRVLQPPEAIGSDLAQDPVDAVARYAQGQTFLFAGNVEMAREYADRLPSAGCVDSKMRQSDRDELVKLFKTGRLSVLANYNVLTEGVDVPEAVTCCLARPFRHVSSFLQACGRVLRAAEGKTEALILDLVGVTHLHGFPTMDRVYSLSGKGIEKSTVPPLRNCLQCGVTLQAALMTCPDCGYQFPKRDPRVPRIFNLELQEVYAGRDTPDDAKRSEYQRLRGIQLDRGFSLAWVKREYKKLFGTNPTISDATADEKQAELARLLQVARARGFKTGWVMHCYKAAFGAWPERKVG